MGITMTDYHDPANDPARTLAAKCARVLRESKAALKRDGCTDELVARLRAECEAIMRYIDTHFGRK